MTRQNLSDSSGKIRDSLDPRLRGDDDVHGSTIKSTGRKANGANMAGQRSQLAVSDPWPRSSAVAMSLLHAISAC